MLLKTWPSNIRSYEGRDALQEIRRFSRSRDQIRETNQHLLKKERS